MLSVLKDRTYRHLFAAQVIALIGTGLMTVALGLLATWVLMGIGYSAVQTPTGPLLRRPQRCSP